MEHIEIKNATKNNLKNVSLSIPLNKLIVFIGRSGSGKSTLAYDVILTGYYKKYANVSVPIKPLILKQYVSMPSSIHEVGKYIFNKIRVNNDIKLGEYLLKWDSSMNLLRSHDMISLVRLLGIDGISLNHNIYNLSNSQINKIRIVKLLVNSNNARLLILDELSAGLIYEEAILLSQVYKFLVSKGYTVIAVEHSLPILSAADHVVELGPGAGSKGGEIIFNDTMEVFTKTLSWESWKKSMNSTRYCLPEKRGSKKLLRVCNVNYHRFRELEIKIPLDCIVSICGAMGSGKSSILEVLFRAYDKSAGAWKNREGLSGEISGRHYLRRPYIIDQTPIGRNSMSTPASYSGVLESLRMMYQNSSDNEIHKLDKSYFSFNAKGKCLNCNGKGYFEYSINDERIYEKCQSCNGLRYKQIVDKVKLFGMSIGEVLNTSCLDLHQILISTAPNSFVAEKINFLNQVGLHYLRLGQPSGTLSAGESQRIKIARELSKKLGDRCMFILDSPVTGLHYEDQYALMNMLELLVSKNNTIVIAENNPFFVNNSNWVIYLEDNQIAYQGTPSGMSKKQKQLLGICTV